MTIRNLPARTSPLAHARVETPPVPEGVPPARVPGGKSDFGLPSQRTIWEREFLVARRSQTMEVSRREKQGPRRTNIGHPPVRMVDRIDPFWEMDWDSQFGGSEWRRVSAERHRVTTDVRGNVTIKTTQAYSPVTLSQNESYTESMMRIMALLFQYGGVSTSQLCSFMDQSLKGISYALNRLYASGLVERMTPSWVRPTQSSRLYHGSGDIWRANLRSDTITEWLEGLSATEYALMTAGRDGADLLHNATFTYEQTLRHNLSVAELCLRTLESAPGVAGVWGEPFVHGDRFLSEQVRNSINVRTVRGDAAIVTKDGAVIIIELTAIKDATQAEEGATLAARAAAWATIASLSDVPMSLAVVSIGGYAASRRVAKHLRENTERELGKYFSNVAEKKKALDAIHMTSIQSWWPSASCISRKFLTLEGFSPFTKEYRELAPADAQWDTKQPVVMNSVAALHTPPWVMNPVAPITTEDSDD